MGYSNSFGKPGGVGTKEGVQEQIISMTFSKFVTKLMKHIGWINRPENMALHSDMRAFLSYIQRSHGDVFRRVVISGLLLSIPKVEDQTVEGKRFGRYYVKNITAVVCVFLGELFILILENLRVHILQQKMKVINLLDENLFSTKNPANLQF